MITHCWILSYPVRTRGWGTKKPMRTKIPAAMEMMSGISRFTPESSLGGEELRQVRLSEREEQHADHDGPDQEDLDRVGSLEASEEPRVLGEVRARRVVFLADQRVVARHDEERKLVDVRRARDLDGSDLVPRLGQEQGLREEGAQEEVRRGTVAEHHPVHGRDVRELLQLGRAAWRR